MIDNGTRDEQPLPDKWEWVTIEEIAEQVKPGFPSGKHNTEGRGVPHLRPMNISPKGEIDLSLVKYVEVSEHDALHKGDVLFNNTNSPALLGKTTYIRKDTNWAYSNHMTKVRLYPGPNSAWVAYCLHYLFLTGYFRMHCRHHVNQASINTGFLSEKVSIPFPPVSEQERIVAEIETQFTRLDAAVAALERAQTSLQRYKASVLKAACEGRLVPTEAELARAEGRDYEPADQLLARILAERRARWEAEQWEKEIERAKKKAAQAARKAARLPARISDLTDEEWQHLTRAEYGKYLPKDGGWKRKYKEPALHDADDLPELPEGWRWASLDQCFKVERGRFSVRPRNDPRYYNGLYPFVQIGDLPKDGGSIIGFAQTLNSDGLRVSKMFAEGTVLVAIVGATIGNTGVLTFDSCCPDSLVAIQASDEVRLRYVELYLRAKKLEIRQASYASGGQPNINLGMLHPYPIPLSPLIEQRRIVEEVERRLSVVAALEAAVEANLRRAERLRQAVLKRAFEGRLVPQDPDDEPAAALLERIKDDKIRHKADGDGRAGKRNRKPQAEEPQQFKML